MADEIFRDVAARAPGLSHVVVLKAIVLACDDVLANANLPGGTWRQQIILAAVRRLDTPTSA